MEHVTCADEDTVKEAYEPDHVKGIETNRGGAVRSCEMGGWVYMRAGEDGVAQGCGATGPETLHSSCQQGCQNCSLFRVTVISGDPLRCAYDPPVANHIHPYNILTVL